MVTGKEHIQFQGAINEDIGANLTKLVLSAFSTYLHQASDAKRCTSVALELIDNAQRYARDGKIMFEISNSDGAVNIRLENLAGATSTRQVRVSFREALEDAWLTRLPAVRAYVRAGTASP